MDDLRLVGERLVGDEEEEEEEEDDEVGVAEEGVGVGADGAASLKWLQNRQRNSVRNALVLAFHK